MLSLFPPLISGSEEQNNPIKDKDSRTESEIGDEIEGIQLLHFRQAKSDTSHPSAMRVSERVLIVFFALLPEISGKRERERAQRQIAKIIGEKSVLIGREVG